ncbi:hypothetical protein GQ54DRAFT_311738 [Martensiomyces pterosporus]|nr:hypothetical protein GQ54DRAFT_311738 [Martensiomyces pterosporus]
MAIALVSLLSCKAAVNARESVWTPDWRPCLHCLSELGEWTCRGHAPHRKEWEVERIPAANRLVPRVAVELSRGSSACGSWLNAALDGVDAGILPIAAAQTYVLEGCNPGEDFRLHGEVQSGRGVLGSTGRVPLLAAAFSSFLGESIKALTAAGNVLEPHIRAEVRTLAEALDVLSAMCAAREWAVVDDIAAHAALDAHRIRRNLCRRAGKDISQHDSQQMERDAATALCAAVCASVTWVFGTGECALQAALGYRKLARELASLHGSTPSSLTRSAHKRVTQQLAAKLGTTLWTWARQHFGHCSAPVGSGQRALMALTLPTPVEFMALVAPTIDGWGLRVCCHALAWQTGFAYSSLSLSGGRSSSTNWGHCNTSMVSAAGAAEGESTSAMRGGTNSGALSYVWGQAACQQSWLADVYCSLYMAGVRERPWMDLIDNQPWDSTVVVPAYQHKRVYIADVALWDSTPGEAGNSLKLALSEWAVRGWTGVEAMQSGELLICTRHGPIALDTWLDHFGGDGAVDSAVSSCVRHELLGLITKHCGVALQTMVQVLGARLWRRPADMFYIAALNCSDSRVRALASRREKAGIVVAGWMFTHLPGTVASLGAGLHPCGHGQSTLQAPCWAPYGQLRGEVLPSGVVDAALGALAGDWQRFTLADNVLDGRLLCYGSLLPVADCGLESYGNHARLTGVLAHKYEIVSGGLDLYSLHLTGVCGALGLSGGLEWHVRQSLTTPIQRQTCAIPQGGLERRLMLVGVKICSQSLQRVHSVGKVELAAALARKEWSWLCRQHSSQPPSKVATHCHEWERTLLDYGDSGVEELCCAVLIRQHDSSGPWHRVVLMATAVVPEFEKYLGINLTEAPGMSKQMLEIGYQWHVDKKFKSHGGKMAKEDRGAIHQAMVKDTEMTIHKQTQNESGMDTWALDPYESDEAANMITSIIAFSVSSGCLVAPTVAD